jgi:PAS domain S-box-containing protein
MKDNHIDKIRKKLITLGGENTVEFFDNSIPNEVLPLLIEGVMSLNKEENTFCFTDEILDSLPDAIIGFNDNKEIIIVNENTITLFGYTKKELLGQALNKLIPSGYSKGHNQHTSNFMNSPSNKKMGRKEEELYGLKKNGKEFSIYISLSPLTSSKGKITLAEIREVTEQKKDTQTLINTMVDFKDIFESSIDEIILVEPVSIKIIKVNETVCFDTGYSKTELIGKNLSKIVPIKDLEKKIYRIMTETRKKIEFFQSYQRKKDGTIYPVEINLKVIKHSGKKVVMAIIRNITKRNLIDKKIARFSQVFEESLNEFFLFDAKSLKFVQANNAAQKNIGYSMKELYKMTPIDIKPEFSKELFFEKISSLINGKQRKLVFETIHERKDKSLYDVEVHLQKMEHGKESLFAAMILDISDRKKTER